MLSRYSDWPLQAHLLLSPPTGGGESWVTGSIQNVTWTVTGDTYAIYHFSLYYTVDGGNSWERIGFAGSADRTFAWTVPARLSTACSVMVVATDASSNVLGVTTSLTFTIAREPCRPAWSQRLGGGVVLGEDGFTRDGLLDTHCRLP